MNQAAGILPFSGSQSGPSRDTADELERLPRESARAFAAFAIYRDLGAQRSLDRAYAQARGKGRPLVRAPGRWRTWARDHRWSDRAQAWDAHLARLARREQEDLHRRHIVEFAERQRQTSRALLAIGWRMLRISNERLRELEIGEIEAAMLPRYFMTAVRLAEVALELEAGSLAIGELLREMLQEKPYESRSR